MHALAKMNKEKLDDKTHRKISLSKTDQILIKNYERKMNVVKVENVF